MSEDLKGLLLGVAQRVLEEEGDASLYRPLLMGFGDLMSPDAERAFAEASEWHIPPDQVLPGAKSAIAIFLPFSERVVISNRDGRFASREWAEAYVKTNTLIHRIGTVVSLTLVAFGRKARVVPPTGVFDRETLTAEWSHKLVAFLCGMGRYGLNRMLITSSGCAGRLISLVTTQELESSPSPTGELCAYLRDKSCSECVQACPVYAIRADGFNMVHCFEHCSENAESFLDLNSAEVCGKCATQRCAFGPA